MQYRRRFWKSEPNASERRANIIAELTRASTDYAAMLKAGAIKEGEFESPFVYRVNNKVVCEKAFVNVIGMADINGFKLKTWIHEEAIFTGKLSSISCQLYDCVLTNNCSLLQR